MTGSRKEQLETLLAEAYNLKSQIEQWQLTPTGPTEKYRLQRELETVNVKIEGWQAELTDLATQQANSPLPPLYGNIEITSWPSCQGERVSARLTRPKSPGQAYCRPAARPL
jgi:hypothetical protein